MFCVYFQCIFQREKSIKNLSGDLKSALIKKALGYDATEVVEEYADEQGEIKLLKRKVTKKNVPPDVTALKMLIEGETNSISHLTDQELKAEKERLIKLLLND